MKFYNRILDDKGNKTNTVEYDNYQPFGKELYKRLLSHQYDSLKIRKFEDGEKYILIDDMKIFFKVEGRYKKPNSICLCGKKECVLIGYLKRKVDGIKFKIGSTCIRRFDKERHFQFEKLGRIICPTCLEGNVKSKCGFHSKCLPRFFNNTIKFQYKKILDLQNKDNVEDCLKELEIKLKSNHKYSDFIRPVYDLLKKYYIYKFEYNLE